MTWRKREIEALKQSLEALRMPCNYWNKTQFIKVQEAIAAAEKALAQPEKTEVQRLIAFVRAQQITIDKLEAALAQPAPVQEPVAWMHVAAHMPSNRHLEWSENHPGYRGGWIKHPLYTTPPAQPAQRTWVGLTDEEKSALWVISRAGLPRYATYASLIEAKLKEKNT